MSYGTWQNTPYPGCIVHPKNPENPEKRLGDPEKPEIYIFFSDLDPENPRNLPFYDFDFSNCKIVKIMITEKTPHFLVE